MDTTVPALPLPLPIPWLQKPLSSAVVRLDHLDDGRLHLSIRHDTIHGVTPEMLAWWFAHIEGEMEVEGIRYPRYRVWHPLDHVRFRYAKRTTPSIGPGAIFHLTEYLGRNPGHLVDVHTHVERLDPGGFLHRPRHFGLPLATMRYTFARVPGGTRYENELVVGIPARAARLLNQRLVHHHFPDEKGWAWLRHNVEEVGNFESFLPALYAAETGRGRRAAAAG